MTALGIFLTAQRPPCLPASFSFRNFSQHGGERLNGAVQNEHVSASLQISPHSVEGGSSQNRPDSF